MNALKYFHWWGHVGRYRDFAAGYIKMPIDYFIGLSGVIYMPLWLAAISYIVAFASYTLLGWYLMNKTHLQNHMTEWGLKYDTPLKEIHEATNGKKEK